MLDPVPDVPLAPASVAASPAAASDLRPAAPLVIDILARPSGDQDCTADKGDPFSSEIIVCQKTATTAPRLGKTIGPELDDFGNAIPKARVKLSDTAEAEANLINKGVGGWNANGAEVRLKIDF